MELKLEKIKESQFEEIIKLSGLDVVEGENIKQSYLPFVIELAEIQEQAGKINFEKPTKIDEQIARTLRLKTVKIRTGSSDLKDARKKIHLLKGNLEQAAYNVIAASCRLFEEVCTSIEKAHEIAETKRKAELKAERLIKLEGLCENPSIYPLGEMTAHDFDSLLNGFEISKQQKIESERKAEEEKLRREREAKIERQRVLAENEKLKAEAEAREKTLKMEREEAAKELAEQKTKADKEAKLLADKQAKLLKIANDKAKKEAEEKKKLQEQIEAKQLAEKKEKEAREAKEKAELEANLKAEKAPDIEKLRNWIKKLKLEEISVKGEAGAVKIVIDNKFNGFKVWANQQINNL